MDASSSSNNGCDIAIVGAGAAGLATAIFAAENSQARRIVLLDGAKSIGAKILVSGGGRCNVTHDRIALDDFNGTRNVVRNILAAFDEAATVQWFRSLGIELKREETGKLFPVSDSAKSVLAALTERCQQLGVSILTSHRVTDIAPTHEGDTAGFRIVHEGGELLAQRVVMATGGRSLPKTGSDGFGWEILRRLGHEVTDTHPALVPLVLDDSMFHSQVSGLSHDAELSIFADGKRVDRRQGSLLWTHFGISGPVAMDASRHWVIASASGKAVEMRCNFLPGMAFEDVDRWLIAETRERPRAAVATLIASKLPQRLAVALLQHIRVDPATASAHLAKDARRAIVHALTALPLPVTRDRGWNYAEVTAGGVPLGEIDYRTMQSRKVPGLYLVGELLDCDGRIGGFNFQWAWSTGFVAGKAVGRAAARDASDTRTGTSPAP